MHWYCHAQSNNSTICKRHENAINTFYTFCVPFLLLSNAYNFVRKNAITLKMPYYNMAIAPCHNIFVGQFKRHVLNNVIIARFKISYAMKAFSHWFI